MWGTMAVIMKRLKTDPESFTLEFIYQSLQLFLPLPNNEKVTVKQDPEPHCAMVVL